MENSLSLAMGIKDEILENRRIIHGFAETGFDLKQTVPFVMERLRSYGYEPKLVGKAGITCTVGKAGRTLLFRADMDALPIRETGGLPFAATNGNAHACGHDSHTAMLLGAAKLLKEHENELEGTIKFMFQPAEEISAGAIDMIENGIMENPAPEAGFALHIAVGRDDTKSGTLCYKHGFMNKSADFFRITVKGKDAHGSRAYTGVDAILIASHIVVALNELVAKETPTGEDCSVLVGTIHGGTAANSVAGEAVLGVTVRSASPEYRAYLLKRVPELAAAVASAWRGSAVSEHLSGTPAMKNADTVALRAEKWAAELIGRENVYTIERLGGGEDFAEIGERIPAAIFFLNCGSCDEGYTASIHQPDMRLNEDALPVGTAVFLKIAENWFREENS